VTATDAAAAPHRPAHPADCVPVRRALLSVSDKTGVIELARALTRRGIELISTGGTARTLAGAGLEVVAVEQLTGFAEMMDGRVKTLHPAIHAGLLARRDHPGDTDALAAHGLRPIDLACVNLYPFAETVRRPDVTPGEVLEQIDIGGPSMIRSAAKNHPFVAVVTGPDQYAALLDELDRHDGMTTLAFRAALAQAAFRRTAEYDATIAGWMTGSAAMLPAYTERRALRYGENPHQAGAVYVDPAARGPSVATARVLHGKPLSYNNLLDAAAALELMQDLHATGGGRPAAAIIKHTNPCGVATGATPAEAFQRALDGDPLAAYGGILAVNSPLDAPIAAAIIGGDGFLEVIVAPDFDPAAVEMLGGRWANVRLLAAGELTPPAAGELVLRSIPGGLLVQGRDTGLADPPAWTHAAGPAPNAAQTADAAFAWTIVKHLKSNAIAIAAAGQLVGAGCGCVDRVAACRTAAGKAGDRARGAVAASDAFFPFPDGPEALIDAGVTCLVHPGGSRRDRETFEVCDRYGVTCLVTRVRHFRH